MNEKQPRVWKELNEREQAAVISFFNSQKKSTHRIALQDNTYVFEGSKITVMTLTAGQQKKHTKQYVKNG